MKKLITIFGIIVLTCIGMVLTGDHVSAPKEITTPVSDEINAQFDQAMAQQDAWIDSTLNNAK